MSNVTLWLLALFETLYFFLGSVNISDLSIYTFLTKRQQNVCGGDI